MGTKAFKGIKRGLLQAIDHAQRTSDRPLGDAPQTFASALDAMASTPAEAAGLRARSDLARALAAVVAREGWTRAEAAHRCGVTLPRMDELLSGRVSRFSLDSLVNMATACGQTVCIELRPA